MAEIRTRSLLAQLVAGFILSILLLEVFFRVYYFLGENFLLGLTPKRTTLIWIDDGEVGRKLAPNQKAWFVSPTNEYYTEIEVNSEGFRDVEHKTEKEEGKKRVVILGDSFVENFQVPLEKTFFRQLERNLSDQNIEVISLGLGNTGTAQQYYLLRQWGLKYKPDVVVQLFLTANDIRNSSREINDNPSLPYLEIDSAGKMTEIKPERTPQNLKNLIKETFKKSRLVELLLWTKQKILERKTATRLGYPLDYHVYDEKYSLSYQKAWGLTQKIILETKRLVEENGGTYVLVVLANNEQVNPGVWEEITKSYPKIKEAKLDLEKPDKLLREFCEKEKLSCLFTLPYFREYLKLNPEKVTHFHYDGHLNETGTNLLTAFLTENLKDYFSTK